MTIKQPQSYNEYLSLSQVLKLSDFAEDQSSHLNFVICHQITELWFKLLNNYLSDFIAHRELSALLSSETVIRQINDIWEVFEHIPSNEFLKIRESLQGISGAESKQYFETIRLIKQSINECKDRNSIQILSRIDSTFQKWKTSHINITEKLISKRTGTGGSDGAEYLQRQGNKPLVNHDDLNQF
jgi:tryptophan 2,3-dioxygenase